MTGRTPTLSWDARLAALRCHDQNTTPSPAPMHRPCGHACADFLNAPSRCCMEWTDAERAADQARQTRHLRAIEAARLTVPHMLRMVDQGAPPATDALILTIARALQRHTDTMED